MLTFVVIYIIVITLVPSIVYSITAPSVSGESMSYNEQIAMRIGQRFSELQRFSGVVASDDQLNLKMKKCMESRLPGNQAGLRLYLSNLIQRDGVSTYHVMGMYLETDTPDSFSTHTVGLSENMINYIHEEILPSYTRNGKSYMISNPFNYSATDTESLFGSMFRQGFAYTSRYSKNGIEGTLVIISSFDEMIYIAEDLGERYTNYLFLDRDNDTVGLGQGDIKDAEKILNESTYGKTYQEKYYIDQGGVYNVRFLDIGDWKLVTRLTRSQVLDMGDTQSYLILISIGVFGIIAIILVALIVRKFISPLGDVLHQMEVISHGDFDARVDIVSEDEIGEVGQAFNAMAEQLEELIRGIVKKEKIEQKMKYNLLISQVDPHFIYNTMNTITYLAQKGRNEDVIIVNKAMIEILRDRLRVEGSHVFDTVEQEINVVNQYLAIQKYRYEGIFKAKIEVDDEALNCLILKSILQPIVENALSHGILENKDENGEPLGGCVSVSIRKEADKLYVVIADNGTGMSEERLSEVLGDETKRKRGQNIGLRNIRSRMHYIYGDEAEFCVDTTEGEGTRVSLVLPADIEEENQDREIKAHQS